MNWLNHILYNTDGSRIVFLHRWRTDLRPPYRYLGRMLTCNPDGSDLCVLGSATDPEGFNPSHFDWRDPRTIIVWGILAEGRGAAYLLVEDRTARRRELDRELLHCDGHMTYRPGDPADPDRWILSDTYPDPKTNLRTLFLYHPQREERVDIGAFDAGDPERMKRSGGELRVDLHPRWSRDGNSVCIDSIHEGHRAMYVLDVAPIVGEANRTPRTPRS